MAHRDDSEFGHQYPAERRRSRVAQPIAMGTAGRPRSDSVWFSAFGKGHMENRKRSRPTVHDHLRTDTDGNRRTRHKFKADAVKELGLYPTALLCTTRMKTSSTYRLVGCGSLRADRGHKKRHGRGPLRTRPTTHGSKSFTRALASPRSVDHQGLFKNRDHAVDQADVCIRPARLQGRIEACDQEAEASMTCPALRSLGRTRSTAAAARG